ncbi:MAG: hypothetical protein KJZ78_20315 [Bryobacteraceae bacterium]|nr:hypothetical protein [Bryobacteraceae bacterium]HEU0138259.1 hypothetical protein [Bryobacteraceae bacterium]
MRRLDRKAIWIATAALVVVSAGCSRQEKVRVEMTEEEGAQLATMVHVADPRANIQLLKGFHDIEQNAWRWTMSKFSVALRPPVGAAQAGATLQLKFSIPDPVLKHTKDITLSASVNGSPLPPETFKTTGQHVYSKDVPPAALASDAITVDFALDKFLKPGDVDTRELGVVVTSVGLEPK